LARPEGDTQIEVNADKENIPLETIARTTGLTIAQLQKLPTENR
jgi:hypothetical protein